MAKKIISKIKNRFKKDNERGSRENLIEELFYDFNKSKVEVFKMNFIRGIFFGLGSVIGGTVVIALFAWLLSLFVDLPGVGKSIEQIQQTIEVDQQQ